MRCFSHIRVQTRYESLMKTESFYILGYLVELIIKIWASGNFFFLNLASLGLFFAWKFLYVGLNHFFQLKFGVEYQTTFPWLCLFKHKLGKSTDTKLPTGSEIQLCYVWIASTVNHEFAILSALKEHL